MVANQISIESPIPISSIAALKTFRKPSRLNLRLDDPLFKGRYADKISNQIAYKNVFIVRTLIVAFKP